MTETIEDMEKFVAERKEVFKKNIFPITDAIAKAIFNSKKLINHSYNSYYSIKCDLKHEGVRISFQGNIRINSEHNSYNMTIKYGLFGSRTVLEYDSHISTPKVFHECEWIDKLNGLVEKIQQEDLDWRKKQAYKRYGKMCKNLSKKECAYNEQ